MYTLGGLMTVDSGRQSKADLCTVELLKTYHEIKRESVPEALKSKLGNIINKHYIVLSFKVTSDTKKEHLVYVKMNPDFNNNWSENEVEVYCDCADFKFRSAYILNQNNSLFTTNRTKISLGSAITERPKTKTATSLLCKHAYAVIKWLLINYKNVMRFI